MDDRVLEAAIEVILRRERKRRPAGKFERGGRWWPSDEEWAECCWRIRRPSRAWPLSVYRHCLTIKHVARLFGVSPSEVRKALPEALAVLEALSALAGEEPGW